MVASLFYFIHQCIQCFLLNVVLIKIKHMKDQQKDKSGNDNESEREPNDNRPLPGEYPPEEDIMNRLNRVERVGVDPDNLSRNPGANNNVTEDESADDELAEPTTFPPATNTKKGTSESDLTKEDYEALGPQDLSMDGGDDEQLKHRVWPVDFAARDLDVPGADAERRDSLAQADEENDHYSLGGDEKDWLEDDPTPTLG
jgi:hypothetical protein